MTEQTLNTERFPFHSLSTELAAIPGTVQQVIQSNGSTGYTGFRVRVPTIALDQLLANVAAGEYPELSALINDAILTEQRKLFKHAHLNGARSVSTDECGADAIEAFLANNKTVSISAKDWTVLFSAVAATITAKVAEVKMLPDTLSAEEMAAIAGPTVRYWAARWEMCRKLGGVVADADREKLRTFWDDASVAAGTDIATSRAVRAMLAGKALRADEAGADVIEL